MTARVLLVDDQEMVRTGLRALLGRSAAIEVVGEASSGREALVAVERDGPNVVLMDVLMADMDGLEAAAEIKRRWPRLAVLMITVYDDPEYLKRAVMAGAAGYLPKSITGDALVNAVSAVVNGHSLLEGDLLRSLLADMGKGVPGTATTPGRPLTRREREVLVELADGRNNREIAEALGVSSETIKSHVASILDKLDLSDRTQAAVYAVRHGLDRSKSA